MRIRLVLTVLALVAAACSTGETAATGIPVPTTTSTASVAPTTAPPTTRAPASTTTLATTTMAPITVAAGAIPVASVISSVEAEYQARWDYYQPDKPRGAVGPVEIECHQEDDVGSGALLLCEATPLVEREYYPDPFPIVAFVTGDDGSVVHVTDPGFEAAYRETGSGLFCRDLIASDGLLSSYFGAMAYWFLEGRPDRMDADLDGVPCATVFPLSDIANFWHGTSGEAETDIHFGTVTDVSAGGSGFELTIDYARFLGGLEADLAAQAAGDIRPGEGAPNDYFILNENPRLRTFPLAADIYPLLIGYRETLEPISVSPSDWIELLAEAERCEEADWPEDCAGLSNEGWSWYGSGQLPYWIQLDDGIVVRVEEQYLP